VSRELYLAFIGLTSYLVTHGCVTGKKTDVKTRLNGRKNGSVYSSNKRIEELSNWRSNLFVFYNILFIKKN
jgi:hypothetical protein